MSGANIREEIKSIITQGLYKIYPKLSVEQAYQKAMSATDDVDMMEVLESVENTFDVWIVFDDLLESEEPSFEEFIDNVTKAVNEELS